MKNGWGIKKIFEIGKVYNGNSINEEVKKEKYTKIDEGVPFIATKDVSYESTIDYNNGVKIPFEEKALFKVAPKNTVLICAEGGSAGRKIGFTNQEVCFGNKLFALTTNNDVDSRYVFYYYFSSAFQKIFATELAGIIGGVSMNKFKELEIPIPPLSEQKRIVVILDKAFATIDKAKANTEKNLQNAKELFESYLQNVFAKYSEDWEKRKVEEVAKVFGGYSFKSGDFKSNGKYQVLRMGNIRPGIIRIEESPVFIDKTEESILKRALLRIDDVIITQTGTKKKRDYGFTVIIDKENYLLNQRIAAIRFSENYLSKFFLYFSWTNFFRDQYFANETGTVGQGNVGIGAVTGAIIPFCSVKQQSEIVASIDFVFFETKELESIYQQKLNDLEELKKSILKKAFNGELTKSIKRYMNWEQAYQLIIANTVCGLHLNSTGRTVTEVPPYACNNHDYGGAEGFRVKIGKTTFIQIPIIMLQTIFEDAGASGRVYNKKVFRVHYPKIAESSTGHPCHIHTVGKIFELSGVAEKINSRNYRML